MPKHETDPDDPMELCGVGLLTAEDTSEAMTECFIEEFLRLGYDAPRLLALFRNPFYTGVNMVLQNRGEAFVRRKIAEVLAWWGQPVPADFHAAEAPNLLPTAGQRADAGPTDSATSPRT